MFQYNDSAGYSNFEVTPTRTLNFKQKVWLRSPLLWIIGSGAVALAHLDGNGTDEAVSTMVHRVQNLAFGYPEGRIELQLIGGYRDQPGGYAEDLFYNIMRK